MSCATCGAKAPEIGHDARSFVCAYCGAQTFVEPARPPAPPVDDAPSPRHAFRSRRSPAVPFLVVAVVVVVAFVLIRRTHGTGSELSDCGAFSGGASQATWRSCPSKATFTLSCEPTFGAALPVPRGSRPEGFDDLTCHCLRDGEKTWFFYAKTPPPLASREDAERVAQASCKMW